MPKYKQLAEKIVTDIKTDRLKSGTRMLSLRQFARQHKISISTAVSCYQELEQLGWLQARPQSGYFINAQSLTIPTPIWSSFATEVASLSGSSIDMRIDDGPLGASSLDLSETTQKALNRCLKRVMNHSISRLNQYPHRQGELILREQIAEHFSQQGFALNAQELVITSGCMDAVKNALVMCTQPHDAIAVSSPCFHEFFNLLSQLKLKIYEIPSQADGVDLDTLERLFKEKKVTAALFSATHMNPQGITLSVEQKKRLARLAAQYKIPVIEDDVYLELNHSDTFHLPAAYYDDGGYVIWCGSFSKSLSPSYRLGWCRPNALLTQYLQLSQGVTTYIQLAIAEFIRSGDYKKHLKQTRYQLTQNKQQYINHLSKHLPQGSCITQPDGGLVLWVQVPNLDTKQLAQKAQQSDLDIRTGDLFTQSQRYHDCFRINIGYRFNEKTQALLDKLIELIGECR